MAVEVTREQSAAALSSTFEEEAALGITRGRRRARESSDDNAEEDLSGDGEAASGAGSSRKRRRSRKGLDKKFECPHEGCEKSYSRAEHLYRHQLNRESPILYSVNNTGPSFLVCLSPLRVLAQFGKLLCSSSGPASIRQQLLGG